MRKTFFFIVDNTSGDYNLETNPYSSRTDITLRTARKWAMLLLVLNASSNVVSYKTVGGNKVYTYTREEMARWK